MRSCNNINKQACVESSLDVGVACISHGWSQDKQIEGLVYQTEAAHRQTICVIWFGLNGALVLELKALMFWLKIWRLMNYKQTLNKVELDQIFDSTNLFWPISNCLIIFADNLHINESYVVPKNHPLALVQRKKFKFRGAIEDMSSALMGVILHPSFDTPFTSCFDLV